MSANNKTSHLIASQVPQFVRDEHETFAAFIEYYYKFLEQNGNVSFTSKNFSVFRDIDILRDVVDSTSNYDNILEAMYQNYIALIPSSVIADRNLILKHAKDFYRSRGTEKSIRFLIRSLFGKEIDFYYPKKDILRASDGKWFIEKSIKIKDVAIANVIDTSGDTAFKFANTLIRGTVTNATAIVEKVEPYIDSGIKIIELRLSSITKDFQNGEELFSIITEEGVDKYISANLFSGILVGADVIKSGSGYKERTIIPVENQNPVGEVPGSGGKAIIYRATADQISGEIISVNVIEQGAGFRVNDSIFFSGGTPTKVAKANVFMVKSDGSVHPNSYNIISSIISLEANTAIGNTVYSNLTPSLSDPANAWISNSVSAWSYSNTGPVQIISVVDLGAGYKTLPQASISGNTVIRSLGILGRLQIVDGGEDYQVGDKIQFINQVGEYGVGASANVVETDANGMITVVAFEATKEYLPGGQGYNRFKLPTCNVVTTTGKNADIRVITTLGYGENIVARSDNIGKILEIKILTGGSEYLVPPKLNLSSFGDGTAVANAKIVTGYYTYPGRYLNDDGHPSGYNFLEDRDYYHNFSYVIKTTESFDDYRKSLNDLIHPAGMKVFGEYMVQDQSIAANVGGGTEVHLETNIDRVFSSYTYSSKPSGTSNSNVAINQASHGYITGSNVYLMFRSWDTTNANLSNSLYKVAGGNTSSFFVMVGNTNQVYSNGFVLVTTAY